MSTVWSSLFGVLILALGGLAVRASAQEPPPVGQAPVVTPAFAPDEWLDADAAIELAVSPPLDPEAGRFAIFIGETDVTPLFTATSDKLSYRPTALPLPSGESVVVVHFVTPDEHWQEIARFAIRVRTPTGFEKATFDPKFDFGNEGQVAEGHAPEENRPPRETYQDMSANTGFTTAHVRNGWAVQSQLNVLGVSHREKALRFGAKGEDAPRLDLSDYRVDVEKGIARASLGHVSFGGNRHLINGFASRGATFTMRLGPRAELGAAWLHGTSIVGWSHFLGFDRREHRMGGATLGIEAFPSHPGGLRLEATALTGSVLPLTGFSQGAVNDAEKSRGWGVRLVAATPGQRARVEAGYSRSRFDNPQDPLLSQGSDLVEVRETTRGARYLEANLAIVPAWAVTASLQARLAATYRHERIEPLYRTIAAFVQADRSNHVIELQGTVGELALQLSHQRYRDNLDDVPSILITRGRDYAVGASSPLAFLLGVGARPIWLPNVNYRYQRTHQKGDGVPDNSGARPTFVPDQVSAVHGLGFDWQGGRWRAAYRIDRSSQDNRQPEREDADNTNMAQAVGFGITPFLSLDVGLDLAFERAENKEIDRTDRTRRLGLSADWRVTGTTSLGARWSTTHGEDDAHLRETTASDLNTQVSQRLDVFKIAGWPLPGQVYFRFGRQRSRSLDREFQVDDSRRNWTVNTGLNLTMF
jgi:hypothetical protein